MDGTFDLVVIGAGPAGQSAAELATAMGRSALIVEQDRPGGAVSTTGGAPTKALREAALHLTGFREEEVYGAQDVPPLAELMPIIEKRVGEVRGRLQAITARQLAERGVGYVRGTARLGPDRTVVVALPGGGTRKMSAHAVLIATGSRPAHLPGIPFDDPAVFDSDGIYSMRTVPRDIVVVGGGPVGVEFATVLVALGVPVTLVSGTDRLLPTADGELAQLLAADLARHGVTLTLSNDVESVVRNGNLLSVALSGGSILATDAVLVAAGRTPNTEGLGLAEAGVEVDDRGRIVVDRYHRTSAEGIYAAGDVVRPALASTARQHGRAAACHACGMVFGVGLDEFAAGAVYGMPEVAGVGLTEEQVRAAAVPYVVGRADLSTVARGVIAGHGGLLKLLFRATDRKLLGVHCLGDIASELIGMGHVALRQGASLELFLTLGLATPTYSSAYYDAAVDGLARLAELMGPLRHVDGAATAAEGDHERDDGIDEATDALPDPCQRPPRPGLVGMVRRPERHATR